MTTGERLAGGEQQMEQAREQARGVAPTEAPQQQAAEQALNDSLRHMIDSVGAEAIFGSPIEREGVTIIPCSEVMMGLGMGGGSGYGPAPTSGQTERATQPSGGVSSGGGIGGGGGAQGRPVAVVAVSHGEARVVPVLDMTKFMLAALSTAGFLAFWLTQTLMRSRGPRPQPFSPARFARAMRSARG
ncbi:MAG: spore germination protein GerW family protein [Ktedonobacterales bacterium]